MPEAVLVSARMPGLVDTRVHGAAHMLHERPIEPRADLSDLEGRIQHHSRALHRFLLATVVRLIKFYAL
jgi:hypothetical protein